MRLGLFAQPHDALAQHIANAARARGWDALTFGFPDPSRPVTTDLASFLVDGEEVESCDAFILRQLPSQLSMVARPNDTLSGADAFRRAQRELERAHVAECALMEMELRGKRVINPYTKSAPFDRKPLQLAAFERAGLPVPTTMITNQPLAARAFIAALKKDIVVKPIVGGLVRKLDDDMTSRLDDLEGNPTMFQELVAGDDVRVTIVDGKIISSVIVESNALDYRSDPDYASGNARYRVIELPPDIAAVCIKAAAICHHVLSGVDLKRGGDRWALLEANSSPVYLDIEQKTGAPITNALLDAAERS
jgi:glutathione synthase/RimK-type ligase-like ATP-grasp enzyme